MAIFRRTGPLAGYSRKGHIELIVEVKQFHDQVKIVFPLTELEQLGLDPDRFSGMFFEESVEQLIELGNITAAGRQEIGHAGENVAVGGAKGGRSVALRWNRL